MLGEVPGERRPDGARPVHPFSLRTVILPLSLWKVPFLKKNSQSDTAARASVLSPAHPFLDFITSLRSAQRATAREGEESRDQCWASAQADLQLDESARSIGRAAPRSLCRAAGPLWREIISKLLQEADACQKMLSVKVRPLQRSLLHGFVPPPRRGFLHFLAFVCSPGANHLLLLFPPERLFRDFSALAHLYYSSAWWTCEWTQLHVWIFFFLIL